MAPRGDGDAHAPARPRAAVLHTPQGLTAPDHPNTARVREYAAARGVPIEIRRFAATTRTAEDAAREIGTDVERIVKSLVFVAGEDAVVVLCSGRTRVDETALAGALGVPAVRRATADFAKESTGYAIGGVPPFAHARRCRVLADAQLLELDLVWAAAGLPDAVFAIAPRDLVRVADAEVASVALASGQKR